MGPGVLPASRGSSPPPTHIPFIHHYPFPAFVLDSSPQPSKQGIDLVPIAVNRHFNILVYGRDHSGIPIDTSWIDVFKTLDDAKAFTTWLVGPPNVALTVTLAPTWITDPATKNHEVILAKTSIGYHIIITSSLRAPIPSPPSSPSGHSATRRSPKLDPGLRLNLGPGGRRGYPPEVAAERPFLPPPHGDVKQIIAERDWSKVGLPPPDEWPQSLKTSLSYILASVYPKAIWWGPTHILLYNDAYARISGSKHPHIFGIEAKISWGELWPMIGPAVERVFAGEAIARTDDLLFMDKLGDDMLPEETYHSWSFVPIVVEGGGIGGFINQTFETTKQVVGHRRMMLLRDLAERSQTARNEEEYVSSVTAALSTDSIDVPFVAFYTCSIIVPRVQSPNLAEPTRRDGGPQEIKINLTLASSLGCESNQYLPPSQDMTIAPNTIQLTQSPLMPIPSNPFTFDTFQTGLSDSEIPTPSPTIDATTTERPLTPERVDHSPDTHSSASATISARPEGTPPAVLPSDFSWPIQEAIASRRAVHVSYLPPHVAKQFEKRGWGDQVREAIVMPIASEGQDVPFGVLIVGCNTRLPYDGDYATWIEVLRSGVSNGYATAVARASEIQRVEQLQSLDTAKTLFFSNTSHELRTPLTLISGPLEDAIRHLKDDKIEESLKLAMRNVGRLTRMVDTLLDFSRLNAGRLQACFKPAYLGAYTLSLANLFRGTIERNNIAFVTSIQEPDMIVYVDFDFWEKICFNVIGNAFKYTLAGEIIVKVYFDAEAAYFSVSDTGVGIPAKDLPKLGERFYRVDSISRSHEGTGIGLSLTMELVKLHGGTMAIDSSTEEESLDGSHGSTFTVRIPLGKNHLSRNYIEDVMTFSGEAQFGKYGRGIIDEASLWTRQRKEAGEQTPSESLESGESGSDSSRADSAMLFFSKSDIVLVVEDNSEMRQYIKSIFAPYCRVIEAQHGKEAVEIVAKAKTKPHLVLTDSMMPHMNGYELFTQLRNESATRHIPVILLTAEAGEEARVEGLLKGFDDYIVKPFKSREVLARSHLQMMMGKRRATLEAAFETQTEEIRVLSDYSPVGIMRVDASGRTVYANHRWTEISGHSKDVDADAWLKNVHPSEKAAVLKIWSDAFSDPGDYSAEFRWVNGNWSRAQIAPLKKKEGNFVGLLCTLTDISERRAFEEAQLAHAHELEATARKRAEEMEQQRNEANERRRRQELLIDITSHELRQPVSAILNCSSHVKSNLLNLRQEALRSLTSSASLNLTEDLLAELDDDIEALEAIYQCGLAQERIANDVLSLSRIQLQLLSIHPVEFELVAEVERILSIFKNEVRMKRIDVNLSVGSSLRSLGVQTVKCDKARFSQVMTNLLSNAIKFTDTSTADRTIRATLEVSLDHPLDDKACAPPPIPANQRRLSRPSPVFIYLSVKDSGPGLKPEDLRSLFGRFSQGSNSHHVFGGSGLGLFVSRQLCELMGGRIGVESTYGHGATFRFYVQATVVPTPPDSLSPSPSLSHQARASDHGSSIRTISRGPVISPPRTQPASSKKCVLITEDNLINQTILDRQLRKQGCQTTLASNGLQAIEQLKARIQEGTRFDVVLMDCDMPVMDGLTAVREIRKMEAAGELPGSNRIYAITANAREGQIEAAKDAGMDGVIIKPYKLAELMAIIEGTS